VGKKNLKKILDDRLGTFGSPVAWLLSAVLLGGCASEMSDPLQSGRVLALVGLQGRWFGPVVPIDPNCGPQTQGMMSIGSKGFGFDPFQSTAVVQGDVEDGHLSGRLVRQGSQHQDLSLAFDGATQGSDTITGTLISGRCHWHVTLRRG
jgi:hypothetical protein